MKNILIIFILGLFSFPTYGANKKDSLIYEGSKVDVLLNPKSNLYCINNKENKTKIKDLLYVKRVMLHYQYLTKDLQIGFIHDQGDVLDSTPKIFSFVCGTVGHYKTKITSKGNKWIVTEDEYFFDYDNKIPPAILATISKTDADSVFFINGNTLFSYDDNFGIGPAKNITQPRWLICKKNNQYFLHGNDSLTYDSLDFYSYDQPIKTYKNNLVGVLGLVEPKYTGIEPFIYNFAKAVLPSGESIVIDLQGNLYKKQN